MINQETTDKIFETAKIEEVVGDFVNLKKKGVNYIGNCPFHNEKTPSFTVSPVKGIFKCFGCGKGGNAIKFIMEIEHYSYPEALKFIAKKYHIDVVERELTEEQKQSVRNSLGRMKGGDVAIEFAQNPDLIGGMRVKVGDDVYDGSMKTRLARLEEKF